MNFKAVVESSDNLLTWFVLGVDRCIKFLTTWQQCQLLSFWLSYWLLWILRLAQVSTNNHFTDNDKKEKEAGNNFAEVHV